MEKTLKTTKLLFIGGFLGAGKTTLLAATARALQAQGQKVGLITNDQAEGLVDTHVLSASDMAVQEVAGSCFCCDFEGLMEAALYLRDTQGCTIILAEPVGSCTDLSATLMQPIKSYYRKHFQLYPLSVLVDPIRLRKTLKTDKNTPEGAAYIYLKQLEEADHLVLNKMDLLDKFELAELEQLLNNRFPGYHIHRISALNGQGIKEWFTALGQAENIGSRIAEIDYDTYAEGEALMGWYNATFIISHLEDYLIPWAQFNLNFMGLLRGAFQHDGIVVGHIKTFLKNGASHHKGNLTGADSQIYVEGTPFSSSSARLVLNIRAETEPGVLNEIVQDVLDVLGEHKIHFEVITMNRLSPERPNPTHRFQKIVASKQTQAK